MAAIPTENFRSPGALTRFALTTVVGVALDLWTKWLAVVHLSGGRAPERFIPGWLHFEYVENPGAVFGLGNGHRWLFVFVSLGAIAFLTFLFSTSGKQKFYQFLLGVLLAGVLGNMYDRVMYAHVRDMIHALPGWNNPFKWLYNASEIFPWVFNVADSLLCVGVTLMIAYSLLFAPQKDESGEVTSPGPEADHGQRLGKV
jgi:signal peptidase II